MQGSLFRRSVSQPAVSEGVDTWSGRDCVSAYHVLMFWMQCSLAAQGSRGVPKKGKSWSKWEHHFGWFPRNAHSSSDKRVPMSMSEGRVSCEREWEAEEEAGLSSERHAFYGNWNIFLLWKFRGHVRSSFWWGAFEMGQRKIIKLGRYGVWSQLWH